MDFSNSLTESKSMDNVISEDSVKLINWGRCTDDAFRAASHGDIVKLKDTMETLNMNVNHKFKYTAYACFPIYATPLYFAIMGLKWIHDGKTREQYEECIEYLISKGADVDILVGDKNEKPCSIRKIINYKIPSILPFIEECERKYDIPVTKGVHE